MKPAAGNHLTAGTEPSLYRIGIDARSLNTKHLRGMGKYVLAMMEHMPDPLRLRWTLFADRPENPVHLPSGIDVRTDLFDMRGYRFHAWEQLGLPHRARRSNLDILHCTGTTLPLWQPLPTIVTVHDTLPWSEPSGSFENWYLHTLIPRALSRAAAIITISQSAREDILSRWPDLKKKLRVIPHGVSDRYLSDRSKPLPESLQAEIGAHPYFLYVGGALDRKRFPWAIEVIRKSKSTISHLIACGFDEREREKVLRTLDPAMRARVHLPAFVDEDTMPALYRNAVAVLYPTLYEGFGLPALEAQAVGTPVLFSALGSLAELQGPDAQILPAQDFDAWVQTADRLLLQRSANASSADAGRRWARRFSWKESASAHYEVYREVIAACGRRHSQ